MGELLADFELKTTSSPAAKRSLGPICEITGEFDHDSSLSQHQADTNESSVAVLCTEFRKWALSLVFYTLKQIGK